MRGKLNGTTDATWQDDGTSGLRGRRVLSWREWDGYGAGAYDRGAGEGVRQSDQHLLVFSILPRPPMLLQVDDDPARDLHQIPHAVGIYPAGTRIRSVGANSRFVQVCWAPELYRTVAPHLPGAPAIGFDFLPDPLLRQLARSLVEDTGQGPMDRLLADSIVTALVMRMAQRCGTRTLERLPDLPRPRMRRVLDYIEAHLEQDLTLAELAGGRLPQPVALQPRFQAGGRHGTAALHGAAPGREGEGSAAPHREQLGRDRRRNRLRGPKPLHRGLPPGSRRHPRPLPRRIGQKRNSVTTNRKPPQGPACTTR